MINLSKRYGIDSSLRWSDVLTCFKGIVAKRVQDDVVTGLQVTDRRLWIPGQAGADEVRKVGGRQVPAFERVTVMVRFLCG